MFVRSRVQNGRQYFALEKRWRENGRMKSSSIYLGVAEKALEKLNGMVEQYEISTEEYDRAVKIINGAIVVENTTTQEIETLKKENIQLREKVSELETHLERQTAEMKQMKKNRGVDSKKSFDPYILRVVNALEKLNPIFRKMEIAFDIAINIAELLTKEEQEKLRNILYLKTNEKHFREHFDIIVQFIKRGASQDAVDKLFKIKRSLYYQLLTFGTDIKEKYDNRLLQCASDEQEVTRVLEEYDTTIKTLGERQTSQSFGIDGNVYEEKTKSVRQIVGLPEDASDTEVNKKFKELLKKLHPDTGGSAYLFQQIKEAYDGFKQRTK